MSTFGGFTKQLDAFFIGLTAENSKTWFDAHKAEYKRDVESPAAELVTAVGEQLKTLRKGIIAVPKVNHSLFRLNRDVRFSEDKSPYKTHCAMLWWEGVRKRMECSAFYTHLQPGMKPAQIAVCTGIYGLPKPLVEMYREAVLHDKTGAELDKIMTTMRGYGYRSMDPTYKKVPRGYPADHPRAEYLKYMGVAVIHEGPIPTEMYGPEAVSWLMGHFKRMAPVHEWCMKVFG